MLERDQVMPRLIFPPKLKFSSLSWLRRLSSRRFICRRVCASSSPAGVRDSFGRRLKRRVLYASSSRLMWLLMHCWEINAFWAALVMLSSSATMRKYS